MPSSPSILSLVYDVRKPQWIVLELSAAGPEDAGSSNFQHSPLRFSLSVSGFTNSYLSSMIFFQ